MTKKIINGRPLPVKRLNARNPARINVKSDNLQLGNLNLIMSGVSDVELMGGIGNLNIIVDEIGDFFGRDLLCNECSISGTGTANIILNVEEKLDINFKGTGSIKYIGNPEVNQDVGNLVNIENIN